MRSPSKRSRSKSNRPKPIGNIVNRVFESSGPEGKVRGTPQQIIDKYLALARDAQLSGDRVASENFLQHAEHYTRMLNEAQREMAREAEARREQQGGQQNGQPQNGQPQNGQHNNGQHNNQHGARRGEGQHGPDGGQDSGRESGRESGPDMAEADNRQAQGEGERRSGGRNRRRDHDRNEAPAQQSSGDGPSGLGGDGEAELVDTPESRAAQHAASAGAAQSVSQPQTQPEAQQRGEPDTAPVAAPEPEAGAGDEAGKSRRKPAVRKPRATTGTRRSPRASRTADGATESPGPADGTSNAAE
ncbi:MAG: DUF4167 domain-containing protein [Pararhodobacter sp.]|nr:DUF4167 domain-containing protein [Pararhodobacter sp.]